MHNPPLGCLIWLLPAGRGFPRAIQTLSLLPRSVVSVPCDMPPSHCPSDTLFPRVAPDIFTEVAHALG